MIRGVRIAASVVVVLVALAVLLLNPAFASGPDGSVPLWGGLLLDLLVIGATAGVVRKLLAQDRPS